MKGLTLNQKEQARLEILNRVLKGRLRASEAARILGVSERHTWRMLAAYRWEGVAALAHGNRGRRQAYTTTTEIIEKENALVLLITLCYTDLAMESLPVYLLSGNHSAQIFRRYGKGRHRGNRIFAFNGPEAVRTGLPFREEGVHHESPFN